MRILSVKWRNFASWGNAWHELSFDGKPSLSLLCGENGAGKSSIPNVIIYMLYGQVDGFVQGDIPNRVNKHFEGIINIESDGHKVSIHRGLMPNLFEVEIDGSVIDTAGKNNVQKYLENEIYKTPYNIFRNSIILSVNDFKSFVKLTPKEKGEIIDRLFGYSIINVASTKAKESVKALKEKIGLSEASLNSYRVSLFEIEKRINALKDDVSAETTDDCMEKISNIDEKLQSIIQHYNEIGDVILKLEGMRLNESEKIMDVRSNLKDINNKLSLYEKGVCPLCGSELNTDKHVEYANALRKSSIDLSNSLLKSGKRVRKIEDKLDDAITKKNFENSEINNLKIERASIENEIKQRNVGHDEQIGNLRAMFDEINSKIAPKEAETEKDYKRLELMNTVCGVFSNDGLKQYVSDIYVPLINGYVEGVCSQLGINYRIIFDTGYDCTIWSLGEEVRYSTLSTGERKKIDVAVTLAFLQIIKTKMTDLNILFLDEVLSGISVGSCNDMLQIFKKFAGDNGLSIYLVHHANLDSTYVDNVIEIEKRNGFSNFVSL